MIGSLGETRLLARKPVVKPTGNWTGLHAEAASRERASFFLFITGKPPWPAQAAFAAVNRDEDAKFSQPTIAIMPGIGYFTRKP
ncbi:MAG: hypothetical protein DME21_01810 [Verrucomicrobia bacterium]|nr:MAG: hypothetical protein DME21_01810 [Verrucomicrobiota bacterium]